MGSRESAKLLETNRYAWFTQFTSHAIAAFWNTEDERFNLELRDDTQMLIEFIDRICDSILGQGTMSEWDSQMVVLVEDMS